VKEHILDVLDRIGPEIEKIFVIDDACPELTGRYVQEQCHDARLKVLFIDKNQGVGGATLTGYRAALEARADIVVKLDGDGQMDPAFIPKLVKPIQRGLADYTKGNRFFSPERLGGMPFIRLMGNSLLSLMAKTMSGYFTVMDPTNGFTAIQTSILRLLPLEKIDRRYFFESDMLFRLGTLRAMVLDVPMMASYGSEKSHLKISKTVGEFSVKYVQRWVKRIIYNYFVRDFNVGTVQLILGVALFGFGTTYGMSHWLTSYRLGTVTPAGTVMLAAIPVILGFQLLLSWVQFDIASVPRIPIYPLLQDRASNRTRSSDVLLN
jgi:glycosyltransferase involved in cell wall biosynthesis